jgi:ribonucleotide monophosphatase NagD (HAD superfamily)
MLKLVKYIALDMDGVIKVGNKPIQGADQTVKVLQQRGYDLMIVTNECRWTPEQLSEKLALMGLERCSKLPIYTAGMAAKQYMLQRNITVHCDNIIGGAGLHQMLHSVTSTDCNASTSTLVIGTVDSDEHIVTLPSAQVSRVILTCSDLLDPSETPLDKLKMPLQIWTSIKPANTVAEVVSVGKPHETVIAAIKQHFNVLDPKHVLFVGDTSYTDILLARTAGFQSALVLTGNATHDEVKRLPESEMPDLVVQNINELLCKL